MCRFFSLLTLSLFLLALVNGCGPVTGGGNAQNEFPRLLEEQREVDKELLRRESANAAMYPYSRRAENC